jgi:hypothetical protein
MILERRTVMAEAPRQESQGDHNDEAEAGPMRKCFVCLTDSASRYAERHRIRNELEGLALGSNCASGDLVSFETRDRPHEFIILSRRWVISSAGTCLELTLDHPARRGPR